MEPAIRQHSLGGSYQQEDINEQFYHQDNAATNPFLSEFYYPAPSPGARSRASSIASQSSASFSVTTDPTEENATAHPPRLYPGDSEGFLVELEGGSGPDASDDPGVWRIPYSELIKLLLNPSTTSKLSPEHPIARIASFVKEEPGFSAEVAPQSDLSSLPRGRPSYSNYHAPSHDPYRGASISLSNLGMRASPRPWDDDARSASSLPQESLSRSYDDHLSAASFSPPSHYAPRQAASSSGFAPPLQRGATVPSGLGDSPATAEPPFTPGPSSAFLPPTVESEPSTRRRETGSAPPRRYDTRESSRPYPSRSRSTTYDSDFSEGASSERKSFSTESSTGSQPLRALNREQETYVWKRELGQLFRVTGNGPVEGEIIIFPAGSYYQVFRDELQIIPSDPAPRSNDWVRAQVCVPECTSFRISNKRPATVRHHFASCRQRENLANDPLGRLCKLQIDAGRRAKAAQKKSELADHQRYQESQARSRTTSYTGSAYSSVGSDHFHAQSESEALWADRQSQGSTMNEQAAMDLVDRTSSASALAGPSTVEQGQAASGQWSSWQSSYASETPAADTTHRRGGAPPAQPSASGSFLSMDE